MVCDALGNPLRFIVTAGQRHDASQAIDIIDGIRADWLLADKGYDSDALRLAAIRQGIKPNIPYKSNRLVKSCPHDATLYKERYKIECMFGFLKQYRRLFARFEKTKQNFLAFLHFVAALQWLK
jgi:transposase